MITACIKRLPDTLPLPPAVAYRKKGSLKKPLHTAPALASVCPRAESRMGIFGIGSWEGGTVGIERSLTSASGYDLRFGKQGRSGQQGGIGFHHASNFFNSTATSQSRLL